MDFLSRAERFFINLTVIILILLLSVQILMRNEKAYNKLKQIEFSVKGLFQEDTAISVFNIEERVEEGFIAIELLQDYSLPQVWLVKNGQRTANFLDGSVRINVKEGDLLLLDCRFSNEVLWFEITELSSNIKNWYTGQVFRIHEEERKLGVVQFYDEL